MLFNDIQFLKTYICDQKAVKQTTLLPNISKSKNQNNEIKNLSPNKQLDVKQQFTSPQQTKMGRFEKGLILIVMMFGHNYVLNQAQSLQSEIQAIHKVSTAEFNWSLYSLPSALSIVFIIPLGILYDRFSARILLIGACCLLLGQGLVMLFTNQGGGFAFQMLVAGRAFEAIGAEVLYMIQGNLASTWMGKSAGLVFILPELGEIANLLGTPILTQKFGVIYALRVGFASCLISFLACVYLFFKLRKQAKIDQNQEIKPDKDIREDLEEYAETQPSERQAELKASINRDKQKELSISNNDHKDGQESNSDENISFRKGIQTSKEQKYRGQASILKSGKIFWLTIALCALNQSLYFPFLDNATSRFHTRFQIKYQRSGYYLCIPFIAAMIITAVHGKYILHRISRPKLMTICSLVPLIGHFVIYIAPNSEQEWIFNEILLVIGLCLFGLGLGSYYSVSFPAVGYAVPESIRGTAYACLCFFQTISMTIVPVLAGFIIDASKLEENDKPTADGYKASSLLFVVLSILGLLVSLAILRFSDQDSYQYGEDEDEIENQKDEIEEIEKSEIQRHIADLANQNQIVQLTSE